jgi:beta-glucanase (GH16 family)
MPVQLFPFADELRNRTYKVWLIAQNNAVAGCNPILHVDGKQLSFSNNCAKTDNFRVDRQLRPVCAAWEDNFNGNSLDLSRWVVENGPAPGSSPAQSNIGTFSPTHVGVQGGVLTLTLTQELDQNSVWHSTGALIHTHAPCSYGTYEWTMRMGSRTNGPSSTGVNISGGVSAGLTYANNSEHEIVFEHSAHSSLASGNGVSAPESIWFVNFHNTDPANPLHDPETAGEGTVTEHGLSDVYSEFHRYKFIWEPGKITYYIDGVVQAVHTTNVPDVPGFFLISYFGRNFSPWGGLAETGPHYFFVTRAAYTPLP